MTVTLVVISLIGRGPDQIVTLGQPEMFDGIDGFALRSGRAQDNVRLILVGQFFESRLESSIWIALTFNGNNFVFYLHDQPKIPVWRNDRRNRKNRLMLRIPLKQKNRECSKSISFSCIGSVP